jgi:Ca2+-transporting ATPase
VRECYEAGIKVIMITGDYAGTARYVARQVGLVPEDKVITGDELDNMVDLQLQERIREVSIFARVVPDQKLRIVDALKKNGEVVAMTGDGVNDAPALKAANIGVAMGARGTDVAREAASLVLLDDDFSSIEKAVKMGRRIYDNLKKAMSYIIAIHMPIAGMSLIPVLFKLPLVFSPVHIAFLEIIIDPACSLVFEAEREGEVMKRPPRRPHERIFNKTNIWLSVFQGLSVLAIVAFVYSFFLSREMSDGEVRAVTFTTLVVANLALILTNLSWEETIRETVRRKNTALWLLLTGTVIMLGIALYVPGMRSLFRFEALSALDLAVCFGAGVLSVAWFEIFKVLTSNRQKDAAG